MNPCRHLPHSSRNRPDPHRRAVMLIDASLPRDWSRRVPGLAGAIGTTVALWASLWQLALADRNGILRHRRDQPLHRLLPRADLRHRAGRAAALARYAARKQPSPGRILRADRLWRGGHVPADQRRRIAGRLHRARDLLDLHLHPGRLSQADRTGTGSSDQVFSAGIVCDGISALRHRADLRRYGHHADLRDCAALARHADGLRCPSSWLPCA